MIIRALFYLGLAAILFTTGTAVAGVPAGLSDSEMDGIRAAHDVSRHAVRPVPDRAGVWRAENPGQQWTAEFDARGFLVTARGSGWQWGLALRSYGRDASQTKVGDAAGGQASGQRFSRRLDDSVEEWWQNDGRGLEHGFILHRRPPGEGALNLVLDTRGDLRPHVLPEARGIAFQDEGGSSRVNYTGLKVWDADGAELPARFEAGAGESVSLVVEDRGARYPVTIDPVAQQLFLKAGTTGIGHRFGSAVAMHGDTAVVGEPGAASSGGAIHVYVRTAGAWSHQATLTVPELTSAGGRGFAPDFGISVAIHGNTIVAGAPGEDSSTTGVNSVPQVVSPFSGADSGAAYVFVRNPLNNQWTRQAYFKASNTNASDGFGKSVAVYGDTVVVGAPDEDSSSTGINGSQNPQTQGYSSGAVYVFVRGAANEWSQQAYIKAGNTGAADNFGASVAMSGLVADIMVVGAPGEDSSTAGINGTPNEGAEDAGAAYVFERTGTSWSQTAWLKAANAGAGDQFGASVAVSGLTIAAGAPFEDSSSPGVNSVPSDSSAAFDAGAAYVFLYNSSGSWTQQAYLKASNPGGLDEFGYHVAVSGNTLIAGARNEDSNTAGIDSTPSDPHQFFNSGAAYVFTRAVNVWSQQSYLKAGNSGNGDQFGSAVTVSGDTVVAGAPEEDSSTTGINPVSNNSASGAGAAYFFSGAGPVPSPALVKLNAALAAAGLSGAGAEPEAAPFGDGVSNILKYAFNMNLSGADSHQQQPGGPAGGLPLITAVPAAAPNQTAVLRFEFVRRTGSGLIYTPQKTADPANAAAWAPLTDTPSVTPVDAAWERVVYEEPVDPAALPQCFGRVHVTVP